MEEFRDFSGYLHKVVRHERIIHDLCNDRKYGQALVKTIELRQIVAELEQWLDERVNVKN